MQFVTAMALKPVVYQITTNITMLSYQLIVSFYHRAGVDVAYASSSLPRLPSLPDRQYSHPTHVAYPDYTLDSAQYKLRPRYFVPWYIGRCSIRGLDPDDLRRTSVSSFPLRSL